MAVHSPNASPIVLARDFRSPVELRFHRIGRGRDLTERQGHGEDFDENRFHCPDWVVPRALPSDNWWPRTLFRSASPVVWFA
jgi:hypothetical protein